MLRLAIESEEPDAPPSPSPSGVLGPPHALLGPRGTRAAVVAAIVLGLSLLIASGLPTRLLAMVHDLPEYSWSIAEVELDPPPPPWLPDGRDGLLAAASGPLRGFEGASALDLDLGAVERAFKNVRWVEAVDSVRRRYPNRIAVALRYRGRPVALARLPGPGGDDDYLIDGSGLILSRSRDAAPDDPGLLIRLNGIEPPADASPGLAWGLPGADDADPPAGPNPVALASAALARFLVEAIDEGGAPTLPDGRAVRVVAIQPLGRDDTLRNLRDEATSKGLDPLAVEDDPGAIRASQARALYLRLALPDGPTFWARWGGSPLSPPADGEPGPAEKLSMLRSWLSAADAAAPFQPGALTFSPRGASWSPPS